ncbi:MAG: S26 family signal peptidase [Pikeienuella sp.]|uniref:S26 family signal peptidase n=1 Tax=Pikeienuella sp. TaxID=2831957 RepID=UPI00391C1AD9
MTRAAPPLLGAGVAIALIVASLPERAPRFLWNASASLPIGLYALTPPGALELGDLVAVRLPPDRADWAASRRYLGRSALLLKRVAAMPGAVICRSGGAILIDGVAVATVVVADSHGRPMPIWRGCRRLGVGQVFLLLAEIPNSLDGRYLGPTGIATIVACARPIWTRGG